jgi:predicted nucleic acid-binding protein
MRYLIDTSAWIEYFEGSESGKKIWELLKEEDNEIFTLNLILAEVISKFKRKNKNFNGAYESIISNSKVLDISSDSAKEAGLLQAETRKKVEGFGLVDSFVVCMAKQTNSKIVTKDHHFKSFKNVIFLN